MNLRALTLISLVTSLGIIGGCSDTNIIIPTSPSTVVPNPSNPNSPLPNPTNPITQHKIEFRVTGNASSVRVRYSNSNDGIAQVTTVLPFVFGMTTNQPSIFLSLEATPISYVSFAVSPFMAAQIFVDGLLFRETASSDFLLSTLTVSGTWRQ